MALTAEHKQALRDRVRLRLAEAVEQARLEVLLAETNLAACEKQMTDFEAGLLEMDGLTEQTNAA
jgi:hypothetical protein